MRTIAICAAAVLTLGLNVQAQSDPVPEHDDAYHLWYWRDTQHLANYTEWWYFNVYDSSNQVQGIFSYLVNNPLNLPGGLLWFGIADMAAVVYTPAGIVNEADLFFTPAFSAEYGEANVRIGPQNAITVAGPNTYLISGASRDGRIAWNLRYEREASSWFAADRFQVATEPWQLMSWLLYMPRAAVSGTLTVDGKTYSIDAPGYHDHNWGEWDLNGVAWNWAQYSQPGLTFDLGDFPQKPGGVASVAVDGQRFVFASGQYRLTHTQWAYDSQNRLYYPTQSIFQAANTAAQMAVIMDVKQSDALSAPILPPKAVIYEQTANYTGLVVFAGKRIPFTGTGFKEYTGIAH